ncbi:MULTISPECIES: hypothetical protein [Streptomyces]|uniref:Uncharacterized protein n=1 Tax=Streptomyces doudnae TaxID=3075536 RepID=A0ABD5EZE1_9ACTN|nr:MULTISPECIES: hypothetical protein [unclassified Streptomyces]MDT0440146.1 hypothetical protein [Streptomyces sp. DSM 41981]MYQ68051.1 hypothetical protein [Streptomyces sp. SID4950]SCE42601.1 hypothetical protein GA0115242_136711 [Streptomyces sp. SolWspMP-5a-2]
MPSYDSSRARFRLADRHVAVLAHLMDGENPPEDLWPSLGELVQINLVGEEGELAPILRDLLSALAAPLLLVTVEVMGEHGAINHGVVVGQRVMIAHEGWPDEEESEYTPIAPHSLVWELARMVNLQADDEATSEVSRVETTMGALDAALSVLDQDVDDEAAIRGLIREALTEAGTPEEPGLTELTELVMALNAMWRITTAWDGEHEGERAAMVRGLAVWDCGPRGYWVREKPVEPVLDGQVGPDSELCLVRTRNGDIWRRITDLLPDKAELIDA